MAITFGSAGAPSQETRNFDSLFTLSLANHQRTMVDNISTSNAFFKKIKDSGGYVGINGGTNVDFPLMYALGAADWFEGYDTLNTDPMNGHTNCIWEWRECSIPITVSHREMRQNAQKIKDLVKAKIQQAELGIEEFLAKAALQGGGVSGGSVASAQTSIATGAPGIEPIASLIRLDPTTSASIGNINQSTSSWWRNQTKESAATTYEGLFAEVQSVYNSCSRGPGGPPDMILCDQYTYEVFERTLVNRNGGRLPNGSVADFPFENLKWKNTMLTWDEFVPDVKNDTATVAEGATDGGTMFFINSKFWKIFYDTKTNFTTTEFMSAPNQPNAQTKHIMWMGNTAVTNRRKQGILTGINTTIAA